VAEPGPVRQMRLVVTADDDEEAVHFYRDVLGLPEEASFSSPDGRVVILDAGRATLEIADPGQAEFIDRVEVGRRVAGHIRVAFEVGDSRAMTAVLAAGGATVIADATRTPWETENERLEAALTIDSGWREVADISLAFVQRFVPTTAGESREMVGTAG
jgi:lactoylglutathione lyase